MGRGRWGREWGGAEGEGNGEGRERAEGRGNILMYYETSPVTSEVCEANNWSLQGLKHSIRSHCSRVRGTSRASSPPTDGPLPPSSVC